MKKLLVMILCLFTVMILQNCSSSRKTAKVKMVSFENDLVPIMQASCTPCHFPPDGKKEPLNSYEAVAKHIDDMIVRISLPSTDNKFMPWKTKKPALTESQINVFIEWKKQNMPK